jgi:hypothetical protein
MQILELLALKKTVDKPLQRKVVISICLSVVSPSLIVGKAIQKQPVRKKYVNGGWTFVVKQKVQKSQNG